MFLSVSAFPKNEFNSHSFSNFLCEVGERVLCQGCIYDSAVYPIMISLGCVGSDDGHSNEEGKSSDPQDDDLYDVALTTWSKGGES